MVGRRGLAWLLLLAGVGLLAGAGVGLPASGVPVMSWWLPHAVLAAGVPAQAGTPKLEDPDVRCAGCHQAIYASYRKTPMAQGSGLAVDGLIPGEFRHEASGVRYRVFSQEGRPVMRFARSAAEAASDHEAVLDGQRSLAYFIGSGRRGRTYLFQVDGQWFELPINYYGKRGVWDMAPAFDGAKTMPAVLPVDPGCLHCHATEVSAAMPEARSRYAGAPFAQGGVGCNACHGDPTKHLASGGHGPITNPDKLTPARRDSACLQCHLEGDAVVYRPGRSLATFVAGEDLADSAVYFVKQSSRDGGRRAASQYEALLRSACKAGSGDRLTCTTCHDPHSSPTEAERVTYFRQRCLSCHTGTAMASSHHPEQPDCAACHMPTRPTSDISHEQLTDHNIQRRHDDATGLRLSGLGGADASAASDTLVPVGDAKVGSRELGLAYAQLAQRGDRAAAMRARELLRGAEKDGQADLPVHVQLGFLEQVSGDRTRAAAEYSAALETNPYEGVALGNLAVLDAGAGRSAEAMALLRRLFRADPSQTAAGMNLAFLECRLGSPAEAARELDRMATFSPDDPQLEVFRRTGMYGGQRCDLPAVEAGAR